MTRAIPLLLPALLLTLAACDRQAAAPEQAATDANQSAAIPEGKLDRSHAGQRAPAIQFQDPDGEPASLADFSGKPVLVNFWATWCAPCIAEMPMLDTLAADKQGKVQVLALSQDIDGRGQVEAFFAKHGFRMLEPYLDPNNELMSALKVEVLPTTILYDAEGREVWRVVGVEEWASEKAAALIAEASGS